MALFNPPSFQGHFGKKQYFEGWYCKHVSLPGQSGYSTTLAIIPGVSLGNDSHSFIQVNVAEGPGTGSSWYLRYPLEEAIFDRSTFDVRIGSSTFGLSGIRLDLHKGDFSLVGQIRYSNLREFPISLARPGIMGPYRYVPAMECYHGLVSAHHDLTGSVNLRSGGQSRTVDFAQGHGYIEKDWGKSFPSAWIWMQANSFPTPTPLSFMLSVAKIPWMGRSFVGFLGYLFIDETYYPFATYTGAKIEDLRVEDTLVRGRIRANNLDFRFSGTRDDGAPLAAPVTGEMTRTIKESVAAEIALEGTLPRPFASSSPSAGLEVAGRMEDLGL
ncbi:MAG: hypothetical protein GW949_09225 [Spirochaetales bacterium]|nr:hypothetical protein [Spirochaetales bacterium]